MPRGVVLIVTEPVDSHADAVIHELASRDVEVFRLHPEDIPTTTRLSLVVEGDGITGELENDYRSVALDEISSAWYRRPRKPEIPEVGTDVRAYCELQYQEALNALYATLGQRWIASPSAIRAAEVKPLQLSTAAAEGLSTPISLITNDSARALSFRSRLDGRCAVKPLRVRGALHERTWHVPWTSIWDSSGSDEDVAPAIARAPSVFQAYIEKAFELRCVVIGDEVFAARIDSQSSIAAQFDFRAVQHLPVEPWPLPEEISEALIRLTRRLDIRFASSDLVVTPGGEIVFLDLNPNGQWLWLDLEGGLPLTRRLADLLAVDARSSRAAPNRGMT